MSHHKVQTRDPKKHFLKFWICLYYINFAEYFSLSGYDFVYKNRTSDIRGGVAIYIKKSLKFKINEELSIFENNIFESLCIEVKVNDKKMFISNVYRPTGDVIGMSKMDKLEYFLDKFDFLQDKLSSLNVDSFICCDTNIDILQYSSFDKAKQVSISTFLLKSTA